MIKLININKRYGSKIIFKDLNIEINNNGIYLIKGDNGSGKSTLLNIIAGFIKFKGRVINDYKNRMAYVFQSEYLMKKLNVREQLELFKIDVEVLKIFRLEHKIEATCASLSSGERSRIALIIALYGGNDLILLDEVLSNLDIDNAKIVLKEILKFSENKIIIMVEHNFKVLDKISNIIEIKDYKATLKVKEVSKHTNNCKDNKKKKIYFKTKINYKLIMCFTIGLLIFSLLTSTLAIAKRVIDKDLHNSLDYNKFYLSKCEDRFTDTGFKISKCTNPSEEELIAKNVNYDYNYDYLLVSLFENENLSVFNSKANLKEGRYPLRYNEVIASEEYYLGESISIKSNLIVSDKYIDVYEEIINLEVVGIYNDLTLYKENSIYFDYKLIKNYFENKILINNQINISEYYNTLDIKNYKYMSFEFKEVEKINFEGKKFNFYNELKDIILEIERLLKYIYILVFIISIYSAYKIFKIIILDKQKDMLFLYSNSISKMSIINNYFLKDIIIILIFTSACLIFAFLVNLELIQIVNLIAYIFIMISLFVLLTLKYSTLKIVGNVLRSNL